MMAGIVININSHICVGENIHANAKKKIIDSKMALSIKCIIIYVPLRKKKVIN